MISGFTSSPPLRLAEGYHDDDISEYIVHVHADQFCVPCAAPDHL